MQQKRRLKSTKMNTKEISPMQSKKSRILYKIPRVVPNQKERFYKEDIFRIHAKFDITQAQISVIQFRFYTLQILTFHFVYCIHLHNREIKKKCLPITYNWRACICAFLTLIFSFGVFWLMAWNISCAFFFLHVLFLRS